uniref:Uncharacterized protein n=1 Tax=Kalanchoe fedtschenkoi TaxID=63787 RepID=A0A7N0TSG1_KALFE
MDGGAAAESGIMLFGVRLTGGSAATSSAFRKSVSMNNLSQFEHGARDAAAEVVAAGYASDDYVHASGRSRERKRGTPWTEEEHRLFLIGLQQVGKGDWRGIARNFVKTRTPTQVASHAQKYFIRQNNQNRRRRRSSLFDITSDAVVSSNMEEDHQVRQELQVSQSVCAVPAAPASLSPTKNSMELEATPLTLGQPASGSHTHSRRPHHRRLQHPKTTFNPIRAIPIPPSSRLAGLRLDPSAIPDPLPLSLRLPTGSPSNSPASSSRSSSPAFQGMPPDSLNSSGDSIISVA